MSLFSIRKDSGCLLIFDIGSGSVAGAIILTAKEHPPTVLYNFRSDIPFHEEATGSRLLSLMLRSLAQVVMAISHEGFEVAGFGARRPKIREAIVSLSAPWVISRTSTLTLRNKEPQKITASVFSELLAHSKEETDSQEENVPKGSVEIEQKLVKSLLNGYETASPFEKKASEAEFSVFESFSLPRVTEKISDIIANFIHAKQVTYHSFSLLAFSTLRELYPNEENFVIVDVSGEQTELAIVKKAVLVETITFPFGRNHLIRMLKKYTDMPASGVSAIFKLYVENNGTGRLFERAKKVFEKAKEEWGEKFSKTLSAFSEETFLPQLIFLTADDDVAPIFKATIETGDWSKLMISPSSFQIITVGNELLGASANWSAGQTRDQFITLISAFASRLRHG